MSKRAREIGRDLFDSETLMESMNASLRRNARRDEMARKIADGRYTSGDVETLTEVEWVDGGYWVAARVFVDFEEVEDQLGEEE